MIELNYIYVKFCLFLNCKISKKNNNNSISFLFDVSNIIFGRSYVCYISSFIFCIILMVLKLN